jgi:tRNA A37 threonylcarbamoyladenosine synthetase subunit TsaC/SUA5/YrdC
LQIAADWAGRRTNITSDRNITITRKRSHRGISVKNKNKFRDLCANLETPASATSANKRRAGPAMCSARDHDALTSLTAYAHTYFQNAHDRKTARVMKHTAWDSFFGHRAKSPQDFG